MVGGLAAAGCGVEKLDDTGGDQQVPTEIQRIFEESCGFAGGCHSDQGPALGLNLTTGSLAALSAPSPKTGVPLVDIGNVDNSEIALQVMSGAMPLGTMMDPVDRAILIGWIGGAELPSGEGGNVTDGGDATDTGTAAGQGCGIDDLVTGTPLTIDAGMGAGQIPPDIGEAIAANCGCHFAASQDDIDPAVTGALANAFALGTLADWQGALTTIQPKVEQAMGTTPMPPLFPCMPTGEMLVSITPEDQMLLLDWMDADAPDGATWAPQ